jgi:hypothetical protein
MAVEKKADDRFLLNLETETAQPLQKDRLRHAVLRVVIPLRPNGLKPLVYSPGIIARPMSLFWALPAKSSDHRICDE